MFQIRTKINLQEFCNVNCNYLSFCDNWKKILIDDHLKNLSQYFFDMEYLRIYKFYRIVYSLNRKFWTFII